MASGVAQLGLGKRPQIDLTSFDCSLSNPAIHPLILAASRFSLFLS
jgi:hypothetical protein